MAWDVLLLLSGGVLVAATLRDVFDTVVVPGGSHASLHVARRLVFLLLPLWRRFMRPGKSISTAFAPLILLLTFITWMALLVLAFGLMAYGLRQWFDPPLASFSQAVFVVGSGLATIGLSETDATGPARWVTLGAGFCGLAVMTMAVTYLLEVQQSVAKRDAGILKLKTSAGDPPSALALLERYATLGLQGELGRLLREGRDWCAAVRQSHSAHPSLIYFRSIGTGAGWPAALGALLDLALITELLLDEPSQRGAAILLRADGLEMIKDLAALAGIDVTPVTEDPAQVHEIRARLRRAGYRLQETGCAQAFLRAREEHEACVAAMAGQLGARSAPLLTTG